MTNKASINEETEWMSEQGASQKKIFLEQYKFLASSYY